MIFYLIIDVGNLKLIYQLLKNLFNQNNYHKIMMILEKNFFKEPIKVLRFNVKNAISHYVKRLLGYGLKVFSKKIYDKILVINMAKINGISMINLLKERIIKVKKTVIF